MHLLTLINLLILLTSMLLFTYHSNQSTSTSTSQTILPLSLPLTIKRVNGTLFPPPNPSIGRAFPNPESDKIWKEIELSRTIRISEEDVRKLGKDPEVAAKFEDAYWGFGEGVWMGQIDVFHQLHCLNSLRKLAYPQYYAPSEKCDEHNEMWYVHINHCVDILLQNLMCTSNVDIITLNWMETQDFPFPDFSINHQCRDFESILLWRKENSVDMNKWNDMKKPKGVKEVKPPKEYFELFGDGRGKNPGQRRHMETLF